MINCLIVDDEMPAREEIKYLLEDIEDVNIVGEASHGLEAIEMNDTLNPDLVILDIQMPKINGLKVAEEIYKREKKPLIIFVTAYDDFAIKAFEVNAIDYLLKPVSKVRLEKALDKIRSISKTITPQYERHIERLISDIKVKEEGEVNKICLYKNGALIPLDSKDIIYCTVEERDTIVISKKGRFIYQDTLSKLEKKLIHCGFFRSHRSFIINLDYIESIEPWFNSTYQVKMQNVEEKIPVSRSQVKEFKKIMDIK